MRRRNFLSLVIMLLIIALSFLNIFVGIFNDYTLFIFIMIMIFVTYLLFGYQRNKSMIEKDIILSITAYLILYYLITYIIGFFIGFTRNVYSMEIKTLISNTLPVLLLIFSTEILRYIINVRAREKKYLIVLSFIAFTLIGTTTLIRGLVAIGGTNGFTVVQQVGLFILPTITTNLLLTYLSINVGYKPAILYRLFMEVPLYVLPIFPKFGDYIESVLRITIPVIVFIWIYKSIEKHRIRQKVIIEKKKLINIFRINVLLFCAILVYFISGLFRYQALVIATGSMQPNLNIGDVVIVDKNKGENPEKLQKGEVVAYKKDNIVICHRIVNIIETGEGRYFETKGDNNLSSDQILVSEDKIVGSVNFKINYIGYPTVILSEIIN